MLKARGNLWQKAGISIIILLCMFLINIAIGSVYIPIDSIFHHLMGNELEKSTWVTILDTYRIPKALTAIIAGVGLSLSGLQMQSFFRNPLAGPYVLGISSGAGLGVALLILGSSAFGWTLMDGGTDLINGGVWSMVLAGSLGAILVMSMISLAAWKVKSSTTLLIIGLMFGSASGAFVNILSYFGEAEELKLYTVWTMGSLGGISGWPLFIFALITFIGLLPAIVQSKAYNAMLLGENYAKSMGININRLRWSMIISTGLMAGSATAFCGPIAFIGISVPHLVRIIFRTADHRTLLPVSALLGASFLLLCDAICQLPGSAETIPINIVSSLLGAPLVIWLILRKNFNAEF